MLWFVAPRDAIRHGAVVGSMETNDERGDPGSLNKKKKTKKKHWFPFHALLNSVEPCLELSRSARCHSGIFLWIWKPILYCLYSSPMMFCYKCRKGDDEPTVAHWVILTRGCIKGVHSLTFSWSGLKKKYLYLFKLHNSVNGGGTRNLSCLLQINFVSHYQSLWEYVNLTDCQTIVK